MRVRFAKCMWSSATYCDTCRPFHVVVNNTLHGFGLASRQVYPSDKLEKCRIWQLSQLWVWSRWSSGYKSGIRGVTVLALARATVPGTVPDAKPERTMQGVPSYHKPIATPASPTTYELDSKNLFSGMQHVLLRPFPH